VEGAVSENTEASRVSGYIPSNVAGPLGSEIKREDVPPLPEIFVCDLKNYASVANEDPRNGVEAADFVEVVHADDDLVKDWDGAANETGVAPLGDNSQGAGVAVGEDLGDFGGGAGLENEGGVAAVFAHPVGIERLEVVGGGICVGAGGGEDG